MQVSKELDKKDGLYRENKTKITKIWNGSFSHNAWQIFFIFERVDVYDSTTNITKTYLYKFDPLKPHFYIY